MQRFIGALDQGTTSTRFIVFAEAGQEVARRQIEHTLILPAPGSRLLAFGRARRDCRAVALPQEGAPRARDARSHLPADARDVLDAMTRGSDVRLDVLKVDGGATVTTC